MLTDMSERPRASKNKADFVAALLPMTRLTREQLEEENLEKLRLLYRAMKPRPVKRSLPVNWKRFSKAALMELYVNQAMPWFGLGEARTEYATWDKDRFLVELERYDVEIVEAGVIYSETIEESPLCLQCGVLMVKRTDRLTHREFWGCPLFPRCRETLALDYHGVPAAVAQQEQLKKEQAKKRTSGRGYKSKVVDGGEEMDGQFLTRAVVTKVPEEDAATWGKVSAASSNQMQLTLDEIKMIQEARQKK